MQIFPPDIIWVISQFISPIDIIKFRAVSVAFNNLYNTYYRHELYQLSTTGYYRFKDTVLHIDGKFMKKYVDDKKILVYPKSESFNKYMVLSTDPRSRYVLFCEVCVFSVIYSVRHDIYLFIYHNSNFCPIKFVDAAKEIKIKKATFLHDGVMRNNIKSFNLCHGLHNSVAVPLNGNEYFTLHDILKEFIVFPWIKYNGNYEYTVSIRMLVFDDEIKKMNIDVSECNTVEVVNGEFVPIFDEE